MARTANLTLDNKSFETAFVKLDRKKVYGWSKIDIYDFSMEHVIKLENYSTIGSQTELIWDGKNKYGDVVANGAYFCRLSLNDNYYWTKVLVVN